MDCFAVLPFNVEDTVPSRPQSPSSPRTSALSGEVPVLPVLFPDEILREIFAYALRNNHTAENLLYVSSWVRAWLIDSYYATARLRGREHIAKAFGRADCVVAKTRHLALETSRTVNALRTLLQRTPKLTMLALCQPLYGSLLHPDARLREFDFVATDARWRTVCVAIDFPSPALGALTHLRLGEVSETTAFYLTVKHGVLPCLTHLSFNAGADRNAHLQQPALYRAILTAPTRRGLQMLVVVVAGEQMPTGIIALLQEAHSRLVVLMEKDGPRWRAEEWLARTRGEGGFWERAARDGITST